MINAILFPILSCLHCDVGAASAAKIVLPPLSRSDTVYFLV